jgi:hypothetical protein
MSGSLPGERWATAKEALRDLLTGASVVRAAVAFVTHGGVDVLADLLGERGFPDRLEIVARGAPITEPDALIRLRDELRVKVSVIAEEKARRFHPKLWLIEAGEEMRVLSGSGNLTAGGMNGNREQFEVSSCAGAEIENQLNRFAALTTGAVRLDSFEGSIAWRTWQAQEKERRALAERQKALDEELAAEKADNREADKSELTRDLWEIYDLTIAAELKKLNGRAYIPSGLRLELEGHRGSDEPVRLASRLCRRGTDGFDELCRHDRLDLTVEYLVADEGKRYHTLFRREIRDAAAARLREAEDRGLTPPAEARQRRRR